MASPQRLSHSVLNKTKIKMKILFGIFALCVATAAAFPEMSPENFVNGLFEEMSKIVSDTVSELKTNLEFIVGFEDDCEECAQKNSEDLEEAWKRFEAKRIRCIKNSANSLVELGKELSEPLHQIIFDGVALSKPFKKCLEMKEGLSKVKCWTNFAEELEKYMEEARESADVVKNGPAKAKAI